MLIHPSAQPANPRAGCVLVVLAIVFILAVLILA
jgi:hypothetical protein